MSLVEINLEIQKVEDKKEQIKKSVRKRFWRDQDVYQRFTSIFGAFKESFKVLMACLLAVFVPQLCDDHVCSTTENVSELTNWNKLVLAFNFIAIQAFIYLYVIENLRESWLIKYFDKDESKPDNNLQQIMKLYPNLKKKVHNWNKTVFISYCAVGFIFLTNSILSGFLIFNDYYLDFRSATVFITNILLLSGKIGTGIQKSFSSLRKELAYSLTLTEPISWNVIDSDITNEKLN